MIADNDIQVWLETFARTQPTVIVPYVKSSENLTLRYKVRTTREGDGGKSVMGQGGIVSTVANIPVALSRLSLNRSPNDQCKIDLVLSRPGSADRNYHFECPA